MKGESLFFISGLSRSGTTLLDKLLHNHYQVSVLSQPFPKLYRSVKEIFFNKINYPKTYYVLNNLFKETNYSEQNFIEFLQSYDFAKNEKIILDSISKSKLLNSDTFSIQMNSGFSGVYHRIIYSLNKKISARVLGSKEINCEEFIPYFIKNGVKCIIIIRDPRDVITSLNCGVGTTYAGTHRPTLFHVRNWRKSAAFCILYKEDPNFLFIKYEDLIIDPLKELGKISNFLCLSPFDDDFLKNPLIDQEGNVWLNNSSSRWTSNKSILHSESIGYFNEKLTKLMIEYIEATCFPEMSHFKYNLIYKPSQLINYRFDSFVEQFELNSDLPSNYSLDEKNIVDEKKRIEMLIGSLGGTTFEQRHIKEYFLDEIIMDNLVDIIDL